MELKAQAQVAQVAGARSGAERRPKAGPVVDLRKPKFSFPVTEHNRNVGMTI
jgi:hypothetical protein